MSSIDAELADQAAAISSYLALVGETPQIPALDAALRDARETMDHGKALWLATLGYLIVIEMLGRSVASLASKYPNRLSATNRFVAGAREFSDPELSQADAEALYSLRCALAHEYSLRNEGKKLQHIFTLQQSGPMVEHAQRPWTGAAPLPQNITTVNVRAVGEFVERLVADVRAAHERSEVVLAPGMTSMDLRNFGQFVLS